MAGRSQTYYIELCYAAYFGKAMEIAADSLSQACEFAVAHADDHSDWKDTLDSSTHWVECINYGGEPVPDEYSEAAMRCEGTEILARRLHETLNALIQACERNSTMVGEDVEHAKKVLVETAPSLRS